MPKIVISIADDDILTSNEVKMIEKFHGVRLTECESEDCISRSETIEWIENLRTLNEYYHPKSKNNHLIDCDNAIDYIKQVPSVLPKADVPQNNVGKIEPVIRDNGVKDELNRVKDELETTTKNDLRVDKEQLKNMIRGLTKWYVKRDNAEVGQPNTAVGLLYDDVMFGIDRLPSVTPQEPFINKPCVSEKVCEHDKQMVLDKVRAEIEQTTSRYCISRERGGSGQVEWSDRLIKESEVLEILDKYKAESER